VQQEGICQWKNSNDTIGNRIRDLPACNAVPQPTAPPAAGPSDCNILQYNCVWCHPRHLRTSFWIYFLSLLFETKRRHLCFTKYRRNILCSRVSHLSLVSSHSFPLQSHLHFISVHYFFQTYSRPPTASHLNPTRGFFTEIRQAGA
jgi:hypothetical protein